jgi:hypothetical protein
LVVSDAELSSLFDFVRQFAGRPTGTTSPAYASCLFNHVGSVAELHDKSVRVFRTGLPIGV